MNDIKIGDIVEILDDVFVFDEKILTKGKIADVIDEDDDYVRIRELYNQKILRGMDCWWIKKNKLKKLEENQYGGHTVDIPKLRPLVSFSITKEQIKECHSPLAFIPIKINLGKDIKLVYINDKKRQVCIRWNDGTTTKATCSEKDEFDINVGFAIAFTRKFFKSDKKLGKFLDEKLVKNNKKKKEPKTEQSNLEKELD